MTLFDSRRSIDDPANTPSAASPPLVDLAAESKNLSRRPAIDSACSEELFYSCDLRSPSGSENLLQGLFDGQAARACGDYDRVDRMSESERSHFIERVIKSIVKNEGSSYNMVTLNDNGSGISVGLAQWNQMHELTSLFKSWYKAAEDEHKIKVQNHREKPGSYNRFERIFGVYSQDLLDDGRVKEIDFTANSEEAKDLMARLRKALDDRLFRHVQDNLMHAKVERAIVLADRYGHHSTRFIAQIADLTNQYGTKGCIAILDKANVANMPEDAEGECRAIQAVIDNTPPKKNKKTGEPIYRTRRDNNLDRDFPPKRR